jgi:ribose 5-phosphate isomerase A
MLDADRLTQTRIDVEDLEPLKRSAATRAAEWIRDGMVVGLGTGSTVAYVLEEIAARRAGGEWRNVIGVPTSRRTESAANRLGIPLGTLSSHPEIDLAIDGADEVDPELRLIKGMGGALLREKVVITVADLVVIAVDESKRVNRLGTRSPLPVEVDPFAIGMQDAFFRTLGAEPRPRVDGQGEMVISDGGHLLVDCHFPEGINDPEALQARLDSRPGVLEHGLFLDLADHVIIAGSSGVEVQSHGDVLP